jgi:excisionase family DNA binding protein
MKATEKLFSPREAAQVLGISYPTLKQWIYKGKIRTAKTAGGHHRVPEQEIDKFL